MNFDGLAPHYDWMEVVLAGRVLQRARVRWFAALEDRRHLLIVGEGHGRSLEVLCARHPQLRITVAEASEGMIAEAKDRLRRKKISMERVTWIHADVRAWLADSTVAARDYDAVLTPFVLDCFGPKDVHAIIAGIAAGTASECVWLVSDFCLPPCGWRRVRGRLLHALMYSFFRVATNLEARRVTPPDVALRAGGFSLRQRVSFNAGLVHADLWRRGPEPASRLKASL